MKLCLRYHAHEQSAHSSWCATCHREHAAAWYRANKERRAAYNKEYYRTHKEQHATTMAAWYRARKQQECREGKSA